LSPTTRPPRRPAKTDRLFYGLLIAILGWFVWMNYSPQPATKKSKPTPANAQKAQANRVDPANLGAEWVGFDDCKLIENEYYDGDSFMLQCGRKKFVFRLYFVDTPETDERFPDRLKEQGNAFGGMTSKQVMALGEKAKRFTREFLSDGCSVFTKQHTARGASGLPRFYAFIETEQGFLSQALVEAGLARVHGKASNGPDGRTQREIWDDLDDAFEAAQK